MPVFEQRKKMWFDYPKDPENFKLFNASSSEDTPEADEELKLPELLDYDKDLLGGRIEICYRTRAERESIINQSMPLRTKFNPKTGQEVTAQLDRDLDREQTAIMFVSSWENFFDGKPGKKKPHGDLMVCNPENKKQFSKQDGFMNVINQCFSFLSLLVKVERSQAAKN